MQSIPLEFALSNLNKGSNSMIFIVQGERGWSVTCELRPDVAIATTGWDKFVGENNLAHGDTCVFVQSMKYAKVWIVTICEGGAF